MLISSQLLPLSSLHSLSHFLSLKVSCLCSILFSPFYFLNALFISSFPEIIPTQFSIISRFLGVSLTAMFFFPFMLLPMCTPIIYYFSFFLFIIGLPLWPAFVGILYYSKVRVDFFLNPNACHMECKSSEHLS